MRNAKQGNDLKIWCWSQVTACSLSFLGFAVTFTETSGPESDKLRPCKRVSTFWIAVTRPRTDTAYLAGLGIAEHHGG